MSKHTSGNWIVDEVRPWANTPHVADLVIKTTHGRQICRIGALPELAEKQANARLIAAAPLMYEALQEVVNWYGLDGDGISDPTLSKLQAALSAAGGE